jgi:hypothetical protein
MTEVDNLRGADMHAQIASKITAFAIALMLNSLMILGVSYVSRERPHECAKASASGDWAEEQPPAPIRV